MEYIGQCRLTGEQCWNSKALQRYAQRITKSETAFAADHPDVTVQPGEIKCEGVVENVYGLGKVCLPYIEPSLIVYQDAALELPDSVSRLKEIKGFRLIKPDGSPWHRKLDL